MKITSFLLLLTSVPLCASTNQIDFTYGRGIPQSSVQQGPSFNTVGSRGPDWFLDILHKSSDHIYIGTGGGHFHSNTDLSSTFIPGTSSLISSKVDTLMGLTRIDLSANSKLVPYAIGGLGWVRNTLTVTTLDRRTFVDTSKNTLGYTAGLGLDYLLSDSLYLGVEVRYQGSMKEDFPTTPDGLAATGQTVFSAPINLLLMGIKAGIKY